MPTKHSLITYSCGYTQPHQHPNRVLPNPSMYNSKLAPSLRCGRSHWLPLVVPCCCPSAPSSRGTQPCRLCHRTHQGQVPRVPTRTARGNQQRASSLCYTSHSYPASFPNIYVQEVPHPQEALVLGMQHPAYCSSPPPPKTSTKNSDDNKEYKGMATYFSIRKHQYSLA